MNSSKVKYKISLQDDWLSNSDFKSWVKKVDGDIYCAKCSDVAKRFLLLVNA